MSDNDPLDPWLQQAFDAERERLPASSVSDRVIRRIRERQRLRLAVLAGATLAGAALLAAFVPGSGSLEALLGHLPIDATGNPLWLAAAIMAGVTLLMATDEALG